MTGADGLTAVLMESVTRTVPRLNWSVHRVSILVSREGPRHYVNFVAVAIDSPEERNVQVGIVGFLDITAEKVNIDFINLVSVEIVTGTLVEPVGSFVMLNP